MFRRKETGLVPRREFGLLRQMTSELDRMFDEAFGAGFEFPTREFALPRAADWMPGIDVFERDNRLITKIDLPGLKKEDVKVEIADGYLAISGERKSEAEEKKDNFYRCERAYGTFYRAVPLPENVKFEDIKATFTDGVLEVSLPVPARAELKPRKVEILDQPKEKKTVAA